MSVEIVVPWRGGCPHREVAWEWVRARYAERHPDWTVTAAECPSDVWVKARAVMPAVEASSASVVVVADADVWTDGLAEAVDTVERGALWAIPHRDVRRLSQAVTAWVLSGELDLAAVTDCELDEPPYRGVGGGGIVVAHRNVILDVPLDPRFEQWGGEDYSWGMALYALAGDCWRGWSPLHHLWHPPAERLSRRVGNERSEELKRRYLAVMGLPGEMRRLVDEGRAAWAKCESK